MKMNVLLIIREEIICIFILSFLFIYSKIYLKSKDGSRFQTICFCAFGHVIFDIITVYTVNNVDIVPEILNYVFHIAFIVFAILYCYELFSYAVHLTFSIPLAKLFSRISIVPVFIYLVLTPRMRIEYVQGNGTYYAGGACIFVGYTIAICYFIASLFIILINHRKLERSVKNTMIPIFIGLLAIIMIQIQIPELLFTGASVTIVTIGVFFALENPAKIYRERSLIDLNTGVKNKNCYEEDLKKLQGKYFLEYGLEKKITCVMCDLNGLKAVNDESGHLAGDELIRAAANVLSKCLKSVYNIYRVGGDEFLAIYIGTEEKTIQNEIYHVRNACNSVLVHKKYPLSIAIGYARCEKKTETMLDLVELADKAMYADKESIKELEKIGK